MSVDEAAKRRFAVIGTPVGHSKSPAMHNAAYKAASVFWEYEAIDCADEVVALAQIARLRSGELSGLNITMPYKRLALAQAQGVDASVLAAGGANVLTVRDGKLWASNTDGLGAVDAIELAAGKSVDGAVACVCGTGPTSSSIACALAARGARKVTLLSRSLERAADAIEAMAAHIPAAQATVLQAGSYDQAQSLVPACDVFVDATPLGMGADDPSAVDTAFFHAGQVVFDVVYGHGVTKLVGGAREHGAVAIDGSEMLVGQAVLSIQIWQESLGVSFPIDRNLMRAVF